MDGQPRLPKILLIKIPVLKDYATLEDNLKSLRGSMDDYRKYLIFPHKVLKFHTKY